MTFRAVNKEAELAAARPTDDFTRAFQSATLLAAARMRELFPVEHLERAIALRNWMPYATDARWRTVEGELSEALEEAIRAKLAEAGDAELRRLDRSPHTNEPDATLVRTTEPTIVVKVITGRFDLRNPYSEDFVRRRGAALVSGITGAARQRIRDAIERGFVEGVPVRTTARALRETLGLDDRLSRAVERQIRTMADAGSDDDAIESAARAYADRLTAYRAETIARTETMTASNQGTLDSWRQAEREGLLPGGMKKRWIHADGSSRTCPICNELGDSDPVPVDEDFRSGVLGESFARPPAHPNCRCTVGLVRP